MVHRIIIHKRAITQFQAICDYLTEEFGLTATDDFRFSRSTVCEVFHENISLISFLFRNCFVSLQRYIIEITKQMAAVKPYLIEKLKQEHCLWSYDNDSIQDMPDDMLIELVMLYLDIDEINMLFSIFS